MTKPTHLSDNPDIPALLAEAQKGLKGKTPPGLAWFPLDELPALTWNDGTPLPAEIARWWVVLACKGKAPGGSAQLAGYLSLLAPDSRAALARKVLASFIEYDTRRPSLEEVNTLVDQEMTTYRSAGPAADAAWRAHLLSRQLRVYSGSAIGEKGVLALAIGLPVAEALAELQAFMRDHHLRRAQIEAMLEAFAASDEPSMIQFLLGVARRHRTAGIKEKARSLVEGIATRHGWSPDQLGDRTLPSAGFDDDGVLRLDYGSHGTLTVRLGADLKPVLQGADGNALKALPDPRQDDDPEQIKEAKAVFANCKKELKQVLDVQPGRFYLAMCSGRAWTVTEWREDLLSHPIVGRLMQRLVWLYDDGRSVRAFRPVEDGGLIDLADDPVELGEGTIRLAHAALLDAAAVKAWLKHFKDYKLKPLIDQFSRKVPPLSDPKAYENNDRLGWLGTAYALRSQCFKAGFERAPIGDDGWFFDYRKDFPSAGIRTVIEFSGNHAPEEDRVVALKALSFHRCHGHGRDLSLERLALGDVPPVLLAEVYGDYLDVARACGGFDPEWAEKVFRP